LREKERFSEKSNFFFVLTSCILFVVGVHFNSGVTSKFATLIWDALGYDSGSKFLIEVWFALSSRATLMEFRDTAKKLAVKYNAAQPVQAALLQVGLTDSAVSDWTNIVA